MEKKWLNKEDIRKNPCIVLGDENTALKAGLPILGEGEKMYIDSTEGHNLIFGATGSKKSRLVAMPYVVNCLLAGENVIVSDLKGEIYEKTHHLAERNGYKVLQVNFRNPKKADYWNILYLLQEARDRKDITKVEILTKEIAELLIPMRSAIKDPYWIDESVRATRVYLNIYLSTKKKIDFYSFVQFLYEQLNLANRETFEAWQRFHSKCEEAQRFTKNEPLGELEKEKILKSISKESKFSTANFDLIRLFLKNRDLKKYEADLHLFLNLAENTRSCVASMISSNIERFLTTKELFLKKEKKEIRYDDFLKQKTIVYLITPEDKEIYDSLAKLFISQSYSYLIDILSQEKVEPLQIRLNYLLDEFCNMPKIQEFDRYITMSRSRNIRFTLLVQNINQLRERYGEHAETIISNCDNMIFLYSNTGETLDFVYTRAHELLSKQSLALLDKEKNEALVFLARKPFFLTNLLDIDDVLKAVEGGKGNGEKQAG